MSEIEHVPPPVSQCMTSPAALHNSRDCKAYLLTLPNGEIALQYAIRQAQQSVHTQVSQVRNARYGRSTLH